MSRDTDTAPPKRWGVIDRWLLEPSDLALLSALSAGLTFSPQSAKARSFTLALLSRSHRLSFYDDNLLSLHLSKLLAFDPCLVGEIFAFPECQAARFLLIWPQVFRRPQSCRDTLGSVYKGLSVEQQSPA